MLLINTHKRLILIHKIALSSPFTSARSIVSAAEDDHAHDDTAAVDAVKPSLLAPLNASPPKAVNLTHLKSQFKVPFKSPIK